MAREQVNNYGDEQFRFIARDVRINGTSNVNVYIGAYAASGVWRKGDSFDDFLDNVAPFNNEKELEKYLNLEFGIETISDAAAKGNGREFSGIYTHLERFYAEALSERRTFPVLIEHDARQVSLLCGDEGASITSFFVTADRALRRAMDKYPNSKPAQRMISHVGLAQFVDLMVGLSDSKRGFSHLIWHARPSSEAFQIRDYFVQLALEEHNAALAIDMQDLIDEVVEETIHKFEKANTSLEDGSVDGKFERYRIFESQEDDFFRKMKEQIEEYENKR